MWVWNNANVILKKITHGCLSNASSIKRINQTDGLDFTSIGNFQYGFIF